jgi:hypothetical protein
VQFQVVAELVRGHVLGAVLRRRGLIALHGDVFALDDRAVILLGTSGTGKSTTMAAINQRGCPILSDDKAVFAKDGAGYLIQPAYPSLRLTPKAAEALAVAVENMPLAPGRTDKRALELDPDPDASMRFCSFPLPPLVIYHLAPRDPELDAPRIVPLPHAEALALSARNTYTGYAVPSSQRAYHFQALARIAERVPVRRVERPDSLAMLPRLVDLLLSDALAVRADALLNAAHPS